ncbi:nucleoside/nucleotide kinase family protein [Aureimonas populi]|uniref:Nucleoside/nucleotide kinase family protein n=1 Tax=Aureimonas populi TaxID=1701758 RepID=A0ABW5CLI1_9HYPH|nr:nucleoside/nucleotide kinase family protein [Aureimonas populi]
MNGQWRTLETLADEIAARAQVQPRRILVALAGPPGVGKSTFSEALRERLNVFRADWAELLPMDGFHYDDAVLNARGHRPRKGAPHTFDVEGLDIMLARVKAAMGEVAVPVFDRALEIARAGARIVGPASRIVLVEGNYLLLDDPRWAPLRTHFDLTAMLEAPYEEIAARLHGRWSGLGIEDARAKLEGNDLPNVRLVLERSVEPDFRVVNSSG